jgi:hypothetical protein
MVDSETQTIPKKQKTIDYETQMTSKKESHAGDFMNEIDSLEIKKIKSEMIDATRRLQLRKNRKNN